MRLRTKAAAYGIGGLVLAGAVLFSGSTLGLLNTSSSGILSVMLTDPPVVPDGVSAVFVTYSSIAVHAVGFNDSGWVSVTGEGTIDTMKLLNFSQTISSATIPSLTYNLIEFNLSKVSVEYLGTNYTATVASGKLVVPIVGGVKVSASNPAAALIDIQPTILNLGNGTDPEFTVATGARALQIPTGEVSDSMRNVGNRYSLQGHDWFDSFKESHSDNLTVSGLALSSSSFSFSATNGGSEPAMIRMIILTPVVQGESAMTVLGSMADSIFFAMNSNGTLELVNGTPGQVESFLGSNGYSLAPGASHSFVFSGTITSLLGKHGVISGTDYTLVLMGSDALSVKTLVAS